MRLGARKNNGARRGHAIVEFAIGATLLIMITVGAADFTRVFFDSIAATNAAATGSLYGSQRVAFSGRFSEMETVAKDDASEIQRDGSLDAQADRYCDCPNNPATGPGDPNAVDCITGSCPGYGQPRVYVRTNVSQLFRLTAPWPRVPDPVDVDQNSYFRVQ